MKNTIIILAALLSYVVALAQDIKPQIAVYITGSIKENDKKALNTEILHALVKSGRYTAVERSKEFLSALDKEQKKQRSGAVDETQIRELGKQFDVTFICIADITKLSNEFQISTRIVNTETSAGPVITGKAYSKLKTGSDFEEASNKIIESMFGGRAETDDKIKPAELTSAEAYNDRAIEFANNGEFDKAIADFAEALRLDSYKAEYYVNRGVAYSRKKEYNKAIDDYNVAIKLMTLEGEINSNFLFIAYISRGTAYYRLEDYQLALEDFTKGIEFNRYDAEAFDSRGDAYRKLKNYDKAINDYETALRLNPNLARAKNNLEAVKQEKLTAKPPPPTMSEFWGSIYSPYIYTDPNAPYFEQKGQPGSSASATATTKDSEEKKTRFGIKAAWHPGNSEARMLLKGGIFLDIPFSNIISFVPEISYYNGGYESIIEKGSDVYNGTYYDRVSEFKFNDVHGLSIPLMLKLSPLPFIYLTAGFNTDIALSGGDYYCSSGSDCPSEIKRGYYYCWEISEFCPSEENLERNTINFGLVFGGGLLIADHFLVDFRYIVDLDDTDYDGLYSHYELGLGWMLEDGSFAKNSEEKETRFGMKAAFSPENSETPWHIKGGIFLDIPFSNIISFVPEVNYYYGGYKDNRSYSYSTSNSDEIKVKFEFSETQGLGIPLMLKLSPIPLIYLTAGFNMDIILSGGGYYFDGYECEPYYSCPNGSPDEELERSTIDYGPVFGGGLLLGNHFLVDFRYTLGLNDICDECGTSSYYELGLGWMF